MAATLSGVTRSPLTAIVFAFELTDDTGSLFSLLVACAGAHLLSTTILKRSILTEKVARRGFHVVREYQVEPLEALFAQEAMLTDLVTATRDTPVRELRNQHLANVVARRQRLYPVIDDERRLVGVVLPSDLQHPDHERSEALVGAITRTDAVLAYPDETLRVVADRMASHWVGALPVVERGAGAHVVGVITEFVLLKARHRQPIEERQRERVLRLRRPDPAGTRAVPPLAEGGLASGVGDLTDTVG